MAELVSVAVPETWSPPPAWTKGEHMQRSSGAMETDLAFATCAGPQRLCQKQRLSAANPRPTLSELLDGINRRLWFVHCAAGSFASFATRVATKSAPAAPAAARTPPTPPTPAPGFTTPNDLP